MAYSEFSGVTVNGMALYPGISQPDSSGTTYYCDGNSGNDSNDGLTWETATKTLAVVFALSHADIARGSDRWARRNTIFIAGDSLTETLIILPQKTDVIGVGSKDHFKNVCIRGNHAPVNAGVGCRFFNVGFEPTTAADIMTLTGACHGAEFHNCEFRAAGAATAVSAIDTTACTALVIDSCNFVGNYSGDVIDIGAGSIDGMRITNNQIIGGANDGIVVTGTSTVAAGRLGLIDNNKIYVVACTINDGNDNTFIITNNALISDAATGNASLNVDDRLAGGNTITDATKSGPWPRLDDT